MLILLVVDLISMAMCQRMAFETLPDWQVEVVGRRRSVERWR